MKKDKTNPVGRPPAPNPTGIMSIFCEVKLQEIFKANAKSKGMTHGQYLAYLMLMDA